MYVCMYVCMAGGRQRATMAARTVSGGTATLTLGLHIFFFIVDDGDEDDGGVDDDDGVHDDSDDHDF